MKTKIFILSTILMLASQLLFVDETKADPAYPYPMSFTQPDGSIVNIIMLGDEKVKWAKTLDGYSIMFNNTGVYEYAMLNNDNDMVPSGITVSDIPNRTLDEVYFLQNSSKDISYSKSQISLLKSIWNMNQKTYTQSFPTTGNRKLLCILIGFTDQAFTKTQADFNNLFNQIGYTTDGATGSFKDYYLENSYNQLNITTTIAGPYTASHTRSYYGANTGGSGSDIRPQELVTEAVNLANADVNYGDFDNNGDGNVDAVDVIHAGYGEESGAGADCIWSHMAHITPVVLDGKSISLYACSPEFRGSSGTSITRIGPICHEFGHILNAPDFYDTDGNIGGIYSGTGDWDIMAYGCWNNSGATPAHHSAYTKTYIYNWATATVINFNASIILNNAAENSNSFYRYDTPTANEYFLIENRQQLKFDTYIPGHGMIIYHVDQPFINSSGAAFNAGSHQGMYPVCANATANPPADYGIINSGGCPFPGTGAKTSFSGTTTPGSISWLGAITNGSLSAISENLSAKTVSFNFIVSVSTCLTPLSVTSSAVTSTTATISWIPATQYSISGYQYEVRTSGSAGSGPTGLIVSGSTAAGVVSANISGLSPITLYNVYVRCDCGYGIYSNWTSAYIFTTSCPVEGDPFTETLESTTFPPTCWSLVTGSSTWSRTTVASGYGAGSSSARANFFYIAGSTPFDLNTFQIDISAMTSPVLKFDYAYAAYNTEVDQLNIYYSANGGSSYTSLLNMPGGPTGPLNTYGGNGKCNIPFVPNSSQWRTKYIALPAGTNVVKFQAISAAGNNLYVDNISVDDRCVWTGNVNTDWSQSANWIPAAPCSTSNVSIPSGVSNMPVVNSVPSSPAVCNALTISAGASLTIAPGKALTAYGATTINGTFTLESDVSGTASFIDNGTVSGNVTVKKYLQSGRWWYLGAPTSNATAVAFGTLSAIPNTGNRLFYWDEVNTHNYINVTNTSNAMPALRGYSFKNSGAAVTAIYTGMLNTGNIGGTGNLTLTTGAYKEGFNLVSNPYPSAINWGSSEVPTPGLIQTNLEPTIWYVSNNGFATYNWQNGIGVNGGQKYIPAMQAFWVRVASGNQTGSLQLTNASRVHSSQAFYKITTEPNIFRLNITDGVNTDETAVGFWVGALDTYEDYDSEKMLYTSIAVPQIYTLSTDSNETAINGQPEPGLNEERIIPLGFFTSVAGTFTFNATNMSDFDPSISVFLEDIQTGIIQDLSLTSSYTFTSGIVNNANRFRLHFGSNITTNTSSAYDNMISIYTNNDFIYVNIPETGNGTIELFDLLGNRIISQQSNQGLNIMQPKISKGIYIVRVHSGIEVKTQKVIIQK